MRRKSTSGVLEPRKLPAQKRAAETVAVIVEAGARILEQRGFEGFNTNAIAERAGVSIGSLYQYFRNKDSLLSAIMERESAPLLDALEKLPAVDSFTASLRFVIDAAVRHQMRRPELARLIDFAERQSVFERQTRTTVAQVQKALEQLLMRPDAPSIEDRSLAALDLLAMIRALVDAAGERRETNAQRLAERVTRAVIGYLT